MKTEEGQIAKTKILRATISIITRGGPMKVNAKQRTKPVLLKDMRLPAEARYVFKDPTDYSSKFRNHPISIELFFGENGWENDDTFLGRFPLQEFLPEVIGSRNIELKLTISANLILGISLFHTIPQIYENIGFIDISNLNPPAIKPNTKVDASENIKKAYQNIMEMVENPQPRQTGISRRGKDLAQEVTISFDEALHGGSKDIRTIGTKTCRACNGNGTASGKTVSSCADCQGTGWAKEMLGEKYHFTVCTKCQGDGVVNIHPCGTCHGNGWVRIKRSFSLQIPAYFDSGAIICVLHHGEPGQFGGLPGHLQITVNVTPHALFTRSGRDICVDLPIRHSITRQGGCLRVPGLEMGSSFILDLPAGTRTNMVFPVLENDEYSLFTRVKTYRPVFLFMMPKIKRRIKLIKEWLGDADIEGPLVAESVLDERKSTSVVSATTDTTSALERSVEQAEFYTRRGMINRDKKDLEHALMDFNIAVEQNPGYAPAYDERCALYLGQSELEKALTDINKALELAPNNAEYYHRRGIVYHYQKNLDKALADYAKALDLDPTNAEIYESRAKVYSLQNDLDATLTDLDKALELDPTRVACYHLRGKVYHHKNDFVKTIDDFTKALKLDPENVSIRSDRGQVYIQQNDLENALNDANKLVDNLPKNAGAYNNRGYIYYLKDEFAKALDDYNKALELAPKSVYVYNNRGQTYLKLALYKQAIEDFNRSLLSRSSDAWLYLWIGQAYQGLGMKKKSLEYCQKALDTSSNSELHQEVQKLFSDLDMK